MTNHQKPCQQIIQKLILLSIPGALLLGAESANAILNINIFDDGPNLKVIVSGSLSQLGTPLFVSDCGFDGGIAPPTNMCIGNDGDMYIYGITGPSGFGGSGFIAPASSVSGPTFAFVADNFGFVFDSIYAIDTSYNAGQPFLSSAIFNGTSLASLGITTSGPAGTWTIVGTSESINVFIAPPSVPGPLPLLGAGAAFGWSRRLRRRISAPVITPPQA
jgi:hypothetical protein